MPIRLVIVDDSPTVRAVLRRLVRNTPDIEVVAEAEDGASAVQKVVDVRPDAVLMDVEMPVLDGWSATERIMAVCPTPILIVTSQANRNQMRTAFEALRHGALDVLAKPEDTDGWRVLSEALPNAIRAIAGQRGRLAGRPGVGRPAPAGATSSLPALAPRRSLRFVALGASTGGPGAVRDLLEELPARVPASVLIVQHIAAGFDTGFAEWLERDLGREVRMARHGQVLRGGEVLVAPGGAHLRLEHGGLLVLDAGAPPRGGHRPSVDELFASCATAHPAETAGVLLTGMGSDGAHGLAELRRAGGMTMVQDEASSIVFGMPRAALDLGAAEIALPPRQIGAALAQHLRGGRP